MGTANAFASIALKTIVSANRISAPAIAFSRFDPVAIVAKTEGFDANANVAALAALSTVGQKFGSPWPVNRESTASATIELTEANAAPPIACHLSEKANRFSSSRENAAPAAP
jgi:hypothetical protein